MLIVKSVLSRPISVKFGSETKEVRIIVQLITGDVEEILVSSFKKLNAIYDGALEIMNMPNGPLVLFDFVAYSDTETARRLHDLTTTIDICLCAGTMLDE